MRGWPSTTGGRTVVCGEDPGVGFLVYGAATLWHLGYPDQARRSVEAARNLAAELLDLCREQGFALLYAGGLILHGRSLADQGRPDEGIGQMRRGLADWQAAGTVSHRPFHLALLAEALAARGRTQEALDALDEALAVATSSGERFWEAELHRLRGEQLLTRARSGPSLPAEAGASFRRSPDVAGRQSARSLELRAATSLSRLWASQDRRAEAREALTAAYGRFTEGFDTPDLHEARALLTDLA
jgi:predicted ATPase